MTLVHTTWVRPLLATALLVSSVTALADTVKGTLTFIKRPPFAGIIYTEQTGSAPIVNQLNQKDKAFSKKLVATSPEGKLIFKNSDPFEHNIYANDLNLTKFDIGLMPPDGEKTLQASWDKNSLVRIGCKIHPKMRSYIANFDSSAYQVFEFNKATKEYSFELTDVPSDAKQVHLMMSKYEPIIIDLNAGEEKQLTIVKKGKDKGQLSLTRTP